MNKKNIKKGVFLIVLFLISVIWYGIDSKVESDYFTPKVLATHFNGEQYVGSKTCMECHADIYDSHIKTAHYNTSAPANATNIKGSFKSGNNILDLKEIELKMVVKNKSFYEHTKYKYEEKEESVSKMDITIGSGVKGQSYLTWDNNKLYQLQASYYAPTDSWINSPNFPTHKITRPVNDACLKCHTTFAKNLDLSGKGNEYNRSQMVYGIDCESCHEPAAKHVIYHRENPTIKTSKFMLKTSTLSRKQKLDACAVCHSGLRNLQLKENPFSFLTGENLDDYSRNFYTGRPDTELDVHGNQYGLLTSSECFKQTPKMDCTTCHNPHENQRGDVSYFNQKCITCHNTNATLCGLDTSDMNKTNKQNCIACHMPLSPSKSMMVQLSKDSLSKSVMVRTHLIKVYP